MTNAPAAGPEATAQGLGVKLFAQGVQARPGSHKTAFGDDGTAPGGLATLV